MSVMVEEPRACPDCGVPPGRTHQAGCDVERCSSCGMQRIGCGCAEHDPRRSFWTGYWPGDEACRLLDWELNEFVQLVARTRRPTR